MRYSLSRMLCRIFRIVNNCCDLQTALFDLKFITRKPIPSTRPPVHNPTFFSKPKIQPTRNLTPKSQIPFRIIPENGFAVPSQSTNPTSPLSKSTPNCLLRASLRNSLSSYRTWHSHSSFLPRCSKRMSLTAKSSRPWFRQSRSRCCQGSQSQFLGSWSWPQVQ